MGLTTALAELYAGVDARHISLEARQAAGLLDRGLVYGEFPPAVLLALLAPLPLSGEGIFVDLGAGAGQLVCAAALSGRFAEARGIELLPALCAVARQQAGRLTAEQPPPRTARIQVLQGDLRTADVHDAEVVFAYATCFHADTCAELAARLQTCQPGTWVISVSQPLPGAHLEAVRRHTCRLPWGETDIWLYRRAHTRS